MRFLRSFFLSLALLAALGICFSEESGPSAWEEVDPLLAELGKSSPEKAAELGEVLIRILDWETDLVSRNQRLSSGLTTALDERGTYYKTSLRLERSSKIAWTVCGGLVVVVVVETGILLLRRALD